MLGLLPDPARGEAPSQAAHRCLEPGSLSPAGCQGSLGRAELDPGSEI